MAVRYADCTRRQHRNREASELASLRQRALLYPISVLATCRHLTGFHGNGHFKSNCNCNCSCHCNCNKRRAERQGQRQRQLSLRGTSRATATATVATRNVKGNCNGNC